MYQNSGYVTGSKDLSQIHCCSQSIKLRQLKSQPDRAIAQLYIYAQESEYPMIVMANFNDDFTILWRDQGDKTAYEAARTRVFGTKLPDRYPIAVVRPKTDQHVIDSIKLAGKLGARVAIRSGGHSWALWSIRQDAVLIDLVDYKQIKYDEATKIVTTTTSVTSSEMTAFVTERGRFIPTGHCAGVGLGGFMLQGGMGHNSRVRNPERPVGSTSFINTWIIS